MGCSRLQEKIRFLLTIFLVSDINKNYIAAEIHSKNGCGGPKNLGRISRDFPGIGHFQVRARQLTSQAFGRAKKAETKPPFAGGFLFSPFPALL
jgi:hypothetical protein